MNSNMNELFSKKIYREKLDYHELFKNLSEAIEVSNNLSFANNDLHKNKPFLPQLLIPFTDKDDFVMPLEHRETLSNNLHKVKEILVIGWKGTEYVFQHLLKTKIGDKPINIFVVNREDHTIEGTLKNALPNAQFTFYNTFSEFMEKCRKDGHSFFS